MVKRSKKGMQIGKTRNLFIIISILVCVLILGIQKSFAYYEINTPYNILAGVVGDFDTLTGDVNMIFYKENQYGDFTRVYSVPKNYVFNDSLTSCSIPCNDSSGICSYSYNGIEYNMTLNSSKKVTCKFYFKEGENTGLNISYMIEDDCGSDYYNSKFYKEIEYLPAYGYEYTDNYVCENNSTLVFDSETQEFTIQNGSNDSCKVYFDNVGFTDMTVNAFVQESVNSSSYVQVDYVPTSKEYTLNEASTCSSVSSTGVAGTITYSNGFIYINAEGPQICNIYLDLKQ